MGNCCENKVIDHENQVSEILVNSQLELQVPAYNQEKQNLVSSQIEILTSESLKHIDQFEIKQNTFYTGDLMEKKANGKGTLKTDKFEYEGLFVNGRPSGIGKIRFTNGSGYEGEFVNGNSHGNGKFWQKDGFTYTGEFQINRFHGKGSSKWADGSMYKGDFSKGKFHGEGTYVYPDKKTFKGRFVNGLKEGEGVITFAGKTDTFRSVWKNGKLVGPSFVEINGKQIELKKGDEIMLGNI